jgi:hypothetical protein
MALPIVNKKMLGDTELWVEKQPDAVIQKESLLISRMLETPTKL